MFRCNIPAAIFIFLLTVSGLSAQMAGIPAVDISALTDTQPARAFFINGADGLDQVHALDLLLGGEYLPANQEQLQNHLPGEAALWYGFRLENKGETSRSISIEVLEPRLDYVDLWYFKVENNSARELSHLHSGLLVPLGQRPVHHSRLYFPADLDSKADLYILARIKTSRNIKTQILIHDTTCQSLGFQSLDILDGYLQGIQVTGIAVILILSFFVRKREYLFFVLAGFCFSVFSLLVSVGGGWLFGEWPFLLRTFPFLFYGLGLLFLAEYSRIHMELVRRSPLANKIVLAGYLGLPLAGVLQTWSPLFALVLCMALQIGTMIIFIVVTLQEDQDKSGDLRKHLPAWMALAASSALFLLDYAGLSGDGVWSFITIGISRLGIMASFFIFSFILMQRVTKLLGQKEDAEERERISRSFLSSMSHEMRSPLNGILGYAQNLDPSLDRQQLAHFRIRIEEEAHVLLQKVDRILDIVRCETGNLEMTPVRFSPSVMLRQLYSQWEQYATHKGIGFFMEIDPALNTFVSADRPRLEQIMSLLIDNAIKFTNRGSITLTGLVKGVSDKGLSCRFSVADTGIGISSTHMSRMFNPESRQSQGFPTPQEHKAQNGMGVGLSLTQRLCGLFNAKLRVESTEGKGSIFSVEVFLLHARKEVPRLDSSANGKPDTAARPAEPVSPCHDVPGASSAKSREDLPLFSQADLYRKKSGQTRILVVDDLPTNRQVISIHLSRTGIALDEAENGTQALEMINMNSYDLVLMDIYMPGMDGFETSRRIRKTFSASRLPVIGITASTEENDLRECIASGMNCFLLKPLSKEKLLSIIGNFIQIKP